MAATFETFVQAQYVAATLTAYVTPPASTRVRIDKVTVVNQSAGAETITVAIAPLGATADDAHRVYITKSVAAGETIELTSLVGRILNGTDELRAIASTGSTLALWVDGVLFN